MGTEANEEFEIEIVDDSGATTYDDEGKPSTSAEDKAAAQAQEEAAQRQQSGEDGHLTYAQKKDKAKKRIAELTRKFRDQERENIRIMEERDKEREQFENERRQFSQMNTQNAHVVWTFAARNKELLEKNLANARHRGDTEAENKIQDQLTEVRQQMATLKQNFPTVGDGTMQPSQQQHQSEQATQAQQSQRTQEQPQLPEAAKQWAAKNSFLKSRADLHDDVNYVNKKLYAEGMDPNTPEFYKELNKRLGAMPNFPKDQLTDLDAEDDDLAWLDDDDTDGGDDQVAASEQQQQAPPEQKPATGSPVGTTARGTPVTKSKQKVRLTKEQIQYCNDNGIDVNAYAKRVAQLGNSNNGYTEIE